MLSSRSTVTTILVGLLYGCQVKPFGNMTFVIIWIQQITSVYIIKALTTMTIKITYKTQQRSCVCDRKRKQYGIDSCELNHELIGENAALGRLGMVTKSSQFVEVSTARTFE